MRKLLFIFAIVCTGIQAKSQDVVYLKNGQPVYGRVTNLNDVAVSVAQGRDSNEGYLHIPTKRIANIRYEDGRKLDPSQLFKKYNSSNFIFVNVGDVVFYRLSAYYEHFVTDESFGLRVPFRYAFADIPNNNFPQTKFETGVEALFHSGNSTVEYIIGMGIRGGIVRTYQTRVIAIPSQGSVVSTYYQEQGSISVLLQNGFQAQPINRFVFNCMLGLGVRRFTGNTFEPLRLHATFETNIGYNF